MDLRVKSNEYFAKYEVADLINGGMDYLFILESPHKAEINNGYPVAGGSGREMTKFIYPQKDNKPLGELVYNKEEYEEEYQGLDKFSLMNTAPAPMQANALKDYDLSSAEKRIVEILEKLRVNYEAKRHRKQAWNQVKEALIDNFRLRLDHILAQYQPNYLIPCGKLAQNYLQLVNDNLTNTVEIIADIPHPSRNQWHHYSSMNKLETLLAEDIFKITKEGDRE